MGLYAKTLLFARRLSIFYLMVGIFSVFFGIFYYKYLPANEAELDTRGFRILDQLASNTVKKDATLSDAFKNAACHTCAQDTKPDVLHQIYAHVRFDTVAAGRLPKGRGIQQIPNYGWSLIYDIGAGSEKDTVAAVVPIGNFLAPILAARADLFDSYVLLVRDSQSRAPFNLIYIQGSISASYGLNADSALSLQKNSDLSDITTVSIGNESYELFLQPFQFPGSKLSLGGLIRKGEYDRQVKSLPTHFVVGMILVILVGLIVLPFVKVFFISPRENINRWDVLRVTMGLYLGTAILVLTGVYFLADFSSSNLVENRLKTVSDTLDRDIRHDLDAAARQLQTYIGKYKALQPFAKVVTYQDEDFSHIQKVDSLLLSGNYPLTARVIWFDSLGNTIAKWNPFTFISPPSSVKSYPFFARLQQKNPDDTSLVLSAGQSNITSEFQMYLARRIQQPFDTATHGRKSSIDTSFGILLPFYLHSGLHPVLPRGYGFCLIDNRTMNVLMHSDARRNLSENLYQESGSNERLRNVIDHKTETWIEGVNLYGSSHTFYCRPIAGQQVSLVVFYDDSTHSENIFRMIHFGAESLLYMALLFVSCLFLSTAGINTPSKLSFTISPIEWIRPRDRNKHSYHCTRQYFRDLIWISIVIFGLVGLTRFDIRIVLYTNLLLPFYALWGFIASRKKERTRFPAENPPPQPYWIWEVVLSSRTVVVVLLLFNLFIFRINRKWQMDQGAVIPVFVILFQLAALASLFLRYYRTYYPLVTLEANTHIRDYIQSVYRSVVVMTIIPALGFLWYGWSVEKIQYLRADELSIMVQNEEHLQHASHLIHDLKPGVVRRLDTRRFQDSLLYRGSRYLPDENLTTLSGGWTPATDTSTSHDPDEPYIVFLDQLFVITSGEYNSYSITRNAGDTSWFFISHLPDSIALSRPLSQDYPRRATAGTDRLMQDFEITSPLRGSLFSLNGAGLFHGILLAIAVVLFLIGLPRLLTGLAYRLFLINLIGKNKIEDRTLLKKYFPPEGKFPKPDFLEENGQRVPLDRQEEYILQTMLEYRPDFQKIWDELTSSEKYFLYAFCSDGYANYRDFKLIYTLSKKGLLDPHESKWNLFAVSFREYILQKKGTREIALLKNRYSVPGLWATIRIPTLIIIIACAILLVLTQESVSHRITVMVTSVGAVVPIILEITKKFTTKGGS